MTLAQYLAALAYYLLHGGAKPDEASIEILD